MRATRTGLFPSTLPILFFLPSLHFICRVIQVLDLGSALSTAQHVLNSSSVLFLPVM